MFRREYKLKRVEKGSENCQEHLILGRLEFRKAQNVIWHP